ncbi:LysR family transcriptional regulator [Thermoactinomyces sp. CICC 10522]|jgi:LysR family transcriptional regulator, transcription activator of glutamate synthase operon|uniref:LysR family transcriptional regulator n=1 Tax=Thermoactinomyces sp. CICC 10522 TaxID=2767427 RepID=UPI0018DBAA41|nr:LysR family transcriptional regulator [Thermoactinomyces sp. CICC 10522]MBH8605878.1 LysR family transcriptional regulator [Thermoactinomyces sp. CICC 10522]
MNIEWFQSFVEAAKQKSLSKAAKALSLSQPALSKHIRNLEHDLDIVLFHRTSTGIELTEAGERFYNRIVPVLAELTAIRQELRQFRRTTPIAIGSLPSLATYYLPPRIKGIRLLDRPMTLMIQNTSWELIQSLQEGRLDAVFVDTSYVGESLWSCELFTESYYAVFPLHHRFHSRKTVELSELCEEPLIVHQAPCDTRKHIIEQMESLGHKPNIISEVAFGDFILGAVAAGMGITIIPELMAKNIGHLQLFALPITNFGRKRSISIATRSRKLGLQLYEFISTSVESSSTK